MPIITEVEEALIGPNAAVQLALPTGVSGAAILNWQLRNGMSVAQLIANMAAAVGVANEALFNQFAGFMRVTEDPYAMYGQGTGGRSKTAKKTEFVRNPSIRGAESGNMLILEDFEDTLAWSAEYLRDARQSQLDSGVNEIVERYRARFIDDMLTRIFTTTEIAFGSGYVVPWAIGTGVNVPFIPMGNANTNTAFTSAHTHFQYINGAVNATNVKTMLGTLVGELRHHGHDGDLYALVSGTDLDAYAGMGKAFVELNPNNFLIAGGGNTDTPIRYAQNQIEGVPGTLFGYYVGLKGVVALYWSDRVPSGYLFVTKSYGRNNVKNGVAIRVHPDVGFGLHLDPRGNQSMTNPQLEYVAVQATHGFGVNDRTNGAVGYIASGAVAYVNPTFS